VVVAAVLVAAVVGALVVLWSPNHVPFRTSHSPLGQSNGWAPDIDSPLFYRSVSAPFGDAKTNYVLRFRPHSRFRFGFDVHNNGTSPLRIEGVVPTSADWRGMMHIRHVLMQHKPNDYTFDGASSKPLTIEPGGNGFLIPIIETAGPCGANYSRGGGESFDTIHLRYSYRGGERTEWYSLPMVIGMVCGNPKRWVDNVVAP